MKYSLPFSSEVGELGLTEAHGLIIYSENELKIEFETKDTIIGVIKSELKSVVIPWNEIANIEVKKKFFSVQIEITATSMYSFKGLPGTKSAVFKAKLKKSYLSQALSLRSELLLYISEKKIELLDTSND